MVVEQDFGLSLQGLTKFYGKQRGVEDITFDVHPGEVMGFLGPNGSGKTTVMRMLMGLLHITRGRAEILGRQVSVSMPEVRKSVGYLPGTLGLHKNQTVQQYLTYMADMRGIDCAKNIHSLCERLSINPRRNIGDLSKGTKQKVGVIQAFMHQPRVLILDEPTSGLDPIVQREFESILGEARDNGAAVLLSSHVMHEVEVLATRVAIINEGKLLVVDDVVNLKAKTLRTLKLQFPQPVDPFLFTSVPEVRAANADGNFIECEIVGAETNVLRLAVEHNVISVESHDPTLEDIFVTTTEVNHVS